MFRCWRINIILTRICHWPCCFFSPHGPIAPNGPGPSTWQHTTLTGDRHPCPGGIRTRNSSKWSAADPRFSRTATAVLVLNEINSASICHNSPRFVQYVWNHVANNIIMPLAGIFEVWAPLTLEFDFCMGKGAWWKTCNSWSLLRR
jgi:hypothetical protein